MASATTATAVGALSQATGIYSVALGGGANSLDSANASGSYSIAIAIAIAIGGGVSGKAGAEASGSDSIAVGNASLACGDGDRRIHERNAGERNSTGL
ncbi:hypothetical protein [Erythrobacter sp. QSSC1-22B]|uniref:hypothetical protein n=1 Tax=Erythrobacter sp. QSSC1-22B TaxID=1860125 RepID=UPI0011A138D4